MRIKLDENVTANAAPSLRTLGHDVDTVLDEALGGACDDDVWRAAQDASRFFVTQDLDFADVRRFAPGTHHGVLLVRIPDARRCDTKLHSPSGGERAAELSDSHS